MYICYFTMARVVVLFLLEDTISIFDIVDGFWQEIVSVMNFEGSKVCFY